MARTTTKTRGSQGISMSHASTVAKSAVSTIVTVICLSMHPTVRAQQPAGRSQATAPYRAPRAADGHADLNGIWQAMNTANWDLEDHSPAPGTMWETGAIGAVPAGQSVVESGEIPYLPVALEKKKNNFASRRTN